MKAHEFQKIVANAIDTVASCDKALRSIEANPIEVCIKYRYDHVHAKEYSRLPQSLSPECIKAIKCIVIDDLQSQSEAAKRTVEWGDESVNDKSQAELDRVLKSGS